MKKMMRLIVSFFLVVVSVPSFAQLSTKVLCDERSSHDGSTQAYIDYNSTSGQYSARVNGYDIESGKTSHAIRNLRVTKSTDDEGYIVYSNHRSPFKLTITGETGRNGILNTGRGNEAYEVQLFCRFQ